MYDAHINERDAYLHARMIIARNNRMRDIILRERICMSRNMMK